MGRVPTALVTGTSSGLGRGTAQRLTEEGWHVLGTLRQPVAGLPFDTVVCDVTDDAAVADLGREVIERWGRLDALVNNAGAALAGPVEELTPDELRWQLDVNVVAPLAVVRACLPALRAARGVVVQVSSVSGIVSDGMFGAYNASKRALEGASEALAQEIAGQGVRVVIVEPGAFNTGIAGRARTAAARGTSGHYAQGWEGLDGWAAWHGAQSPDPRHCVDAIVAAITRPGAPLRLPVGEGVADELRRHAQELLAQAEAAEAFLSSA
jgi:NAD(P)-dependent dehydrogenase (short-subunit alcohol dehydrogenase family)